jgi:hypothetical protein
MKKRQEVYDLYWYFAYERQNIFIRKKSGEKPPWTDDPIFLEYKFCNTYRVNDRVSQYLLRNVIYNGMAYSDGDMVFRILLFKFFNKEATWEILEDAAGDIRLSNFNFDKYSEVLEKEIASGRAIYNDAYISCANKAFGYERKHDNHLALLENIFFEDKAHLDILKSKTMKEAFRVLKSYPLIGDFMAYQLITDINYSDVVDWSEHEFTAVGPGSERGIKKCFEDIEGYADEEVIRYMYENQDKEFERLGFDFQRIGDRSLQYIDCQGLFCEVDKYCRQALPVLRSNRVKIKKKYVPKQDKIEFVYPRKWNIL